MTSKDKLVPIVPTQEMCPGAGCTDQGCPAHYANDYPPAPEVAKLVEALEHISIMDSMSYHSLESAKIVARKALTTYRKEGGQ